MIPQEKTPRPINELILSEMNKQGLSASDLAKKLQISMNSMYHILKSPTLQIHRLIDISWALQLNFFKIIADEINIQNPLDPEKEALKVENKTLKEVIKLLGKE
ncbi:hypothetical protein [Ancylomarina longa]|uniref:XRE family transcriptional regulator n=1 Tax=Ancylomarina longa TaxID=2487017 RepID=A0A434ATJ3_9BACT|nr:hypothetical protein [Ancylomarina longa]RUT77745.1 hypothetical protein DLK05_11805 [Ancylomarina longa]